MLEYRERQLTNGETKVILCRCTDYIVKYPSLLRQSRREIDCLIKLLLLLLAPVKLNDSYVLLSTIIMVPLPLLNNCVVGLLCFELKAVNSAYLLLFGVIRLKAVNGASFTAFRSYTDSSSDVQYVYYNSKHFLSVGTFDFFTSRSDRY